MRRETEPIPVEIVDAFYLAVWDLAFSGRLVRNGDAFGRGNHTSQRHGLAILWCTACAMRFSELRRLRAADIATAGSSAYVTRSKRGASGSVPVDPDLVNLTMQWRSKRVHVMESRWLLSSRNGGQLDCDVFNRDVCDPLGALFGCRLSSHCFRDTACQMAMSQAGSVRIVQRLMGHKQARTTEHYLAKQKAASFRLGLRSE
jgi:integrase